MNAEEVVSRMRRTSMAAVLIVSYALLDWLAVDRWQIAGRVESAHTREGIEGAWVIANFSGDEFLINFPFQPHPKHRTSKCMGTRVTRTDRDGRFRFDELAVVRPLLDKSAYVIAFKPGWISEATSAPISSGLIAIRPSITISSQKAAGRMQRTTIYSDKMASAIDLSEQQRSDELFSTQSVIAEAKSTCDYQSEVVIAAMTHALQIARTFDERDRARTACRGVKRRLASLPAKPEWPFDCDNLAFKHEPSAAALALEAELEVKRRRWRELHPEGGS